MEKFENNKLILEIFWNFTKSGNILEKILEECNYKICLLMKTSDCGKKLSCKIVICPGFVIKNKTSLVVGTMLYIIYVYFSMGCGDFTILYVMYISVWAVETSPYYICIFQYGL